MSTGQPLRHNDYLDHIFEAISLIRGYVEGFSKEDFLADKRTQQAVILNIVVIGEAATKLADEYPEFVARYPEVQWKSMRGMRNCMAHGYFDINRYQPRYCVGNDTAIHSNPCSANPANSTATKLKPL